ncbi:hypothetical protein [Streptomyces glomeratus]|uniref:Condensation domain-containing protein n=1 Tax=Streptomyces glomeratus TaxID=284452 RepID=A0ABP6M3W0_9ACTN|nr:hypothetical protein [Streptomyces glomeratus]MCF1511527.1 hypothetical protein [Streptomyces glomeratus]
MTDVFTEAGTQPKPVLWYGLPYGYLQLDLDPPVERVVELIKQVLSLPDDLRDRAERVVRFYTGVVGLLNAQNVLGCAMGLHPDEGDGFTSSVLTVSTFPVTADNAKLVLASLAGTAADRPDEGMRPLELPCGTGFLAEKRRRAPAPGVPPEGSDTPLEGTVWQGTVAVTGPGTRDIAVVQLVTSAVDLADSYRDVLLGVAHTLSFTDPALMNSADSGSVIPGSGPADAIWNDFG